MAGVIGALNAFLENKRRVAKRQLRDLVSSPANFDRMQAARFAEDQERYMKDPASGLDFVAGPLGGLAGVVKPKGGNWLGGEVENIMNWLKKGGIGNRAEALNQFVEGPLTKYVKRDMATEGDPLRKLAEEGKLHFNQEAVLDPENLAWEIANPKVGQVFKGRNEAGRRWEALSDVFPEAALAGREVNKPSVLKENPWLEKTDPKAVVYKAPPEQFGEGMLFDNLGFQHMVDELSNAMDPTSGLPKHLLLTPEQMGQMGVEKAARHVNEINKWRAENMAQTQRELGEKGLVVREYAENNPLGLRWLELKAGNAIPEEELKKLSSSDLERYNRYLESGDSPIEALRGAVGDDNYLVKELERQLKYEGDTMGHCVGGYCEDVLSGRSRIFSLRDAKGEPHVTIEVRPPRDKKHANELTWLNFVAPREIADEISSAAGPGAKMDVFNELISARPEYQQWIKNPDRMKIHQIKGKQNLAPKPEYLPFVQDFVRNNPLGEQGWASVSDLGNTGLTHFNGQYYTQEELANLADQLKRSGD